jgi:zinc protease
MRTLALTCLLLAPSVALALTPKTPVADPAKQVEQWTLPNQLHVIFVPDHKAPVVAVQVFYHAGGKDEPADKRGIAHMFEHMMFKGSRRVRPEFHSRFINEVGGNDNAFTEDDVTAYHNTVPPSALEFTIQLEAERMRNLELTQKTIDSERQVVIEELRMRLENSPVAKAIDKMLHMAYTTHPYRQEAIGEKKMLESVTVADCKKFYEAYYQPNNATVIVAGDTDVATVRSLVDKYFGPLKAGPTPPRPADALKEPEQKEQRVQSLSLQVQLPFVIGAYHIPAGDSADLFAFGVLEHILSGGESSRMFQRLVRKDKLAVAAGGQLMQHEDPGLFLIFAAFLPGGDTAKIRAALEDEIKKIVDQPVTARELLKAKNQLASNAIQEREKVEDLATRMGLDSVISKDPMRAFSAAQKYDAVTISDVQRVARKYLVSTNESVVILQPIAAKPAQAPAKGGAQ